MSEILFKHMMSSAADALISYDIDEANQVVNISMKTSRGLDFLSTSHLESFIFGHLLNQGINAIHDKNLKSVELLRPAWKVLLVVGETRFEVVAWNQLADGSRQNRCFELYPV